jgi:pimeloyl-ACP methyl ester carboxylesterase
MILLELFLYGSIFLAIAQSTATYLILWMYWHLESIKNPALTLPTRWVFITAWFFESIYNWLFFCCVCATPIPLKPLNTSHTDQTPILLVHGYAFNQLGWLRFRHLLSKKNVGPIYTLNLGSPFSDIETLSQHLQTKIDSIFEETEINEIILIGHSMGGLVSAHYAEHLAKPDTVKAIITLGTPFAGTWLAVFGYGKNALQMRPESTFLKTLTQKIQQSSIPYYHVTSKMDNGIIPWDSALPTSTDLQKQCIVENTGHLGLLISAQIIQQVIAWIKAPPFKS